MFLCLLIFVSICVFENCAQNTSSQELPPNKNNKPDSNNIKEVGKWLIYGTWESGMVDREENRHYEYEGYDGFYNNFAKPDLGAIDRPLLRRIPAAYKDGSYKPSGFDRPNPFKLSDELLYENKSVQSTTGKNALLVFFGQQVVEEILDAQRAACPPEYFNIPIEKDHKFAKFHSSFPLLRTRYDQRTGYSPNNPRQQLNEITPYIDGGLFYGTSKQWSDRLRTYANGTMDDNGKLASSHNGKFPEYNNESLPMANPPPPFFHGDFIKNHETARVSRFFKLGNPRGNENIFLLTFGVMWFRFHNYLAETIKRNNPNYSSEKIYNEARKWTIAVQQNIYIYEWLPTWVGEGLAKYPGYDPSVDPQIDQFFQAAAFRFGHTLVVPAVYERDYHDKNNCQYSTIRTCNSFWRPDAILRETKNLDSFIDRLLMGMSVQLCERADNQIVEDLRGNVFGPLEFPRRDLMAINIQRGRDHGLPDYNTIRKSFGLKENNFSNFTWLDSKTRNKFETLYNSDSSKIDLWVGGLLETQDDKPGELFRKIILDQFNRIRNGDRFWFENTNSNSLFTTKEVNRIRSITISDVIRAVTEIKKNDIPMFPFKVAVPVNDSILINECHLTKDGKYFALPPRPTLEPCTESGKYDYFSNSEVSYIVTFIAIGTFVLGGIGIVYILIGLKQKRQLRDSKSRSKIQRQTLKSSKNVHFPLFVTEEWVGRKSPSRKVVIVLNSDLKQIMVNDFHGNLVRALDFKVGSSHEIKVYSITDEPTVIIQSKNNYDLVLKFDTQYLADNYLKDLETFVDLCNIKRILIGNFNWSSMLKQVITKENRQKRLEMFFRVVFAQAFKIKEHSKEEMLKVDADVAKEVVDTELTISEFADSLSMTPKNEFVRRMFNLIDKDKNGFISFREFIDLLIIFANGTEVEKAKLLFDMYDIYYTGLLTADDFVSMIKSFLETVGGKVDDRDIQKTVKVMMQSAGVEHKKNWDFEDFQKIIGKDIQNLNTARLGFTGIKKEDRGSYLHSARETLENIYESKDIMERFKGNAAEHHNRNQQVSKIIDDAQEEELKHEEKLKSKGSKTTSPKGVLKLIELKSKEIFWLSLYTLVLLAIFAERAYYYSVEREHSGLRRIAGYGVTITRGAASAMMFTYSSLLVTMCRNTMTYLRDTVAKNYFPFDAMVEIHKYIAIWAFIFTVLHIVGHAFNFYHISTQTADDLTCLFRNYFHSSHELPKFHYWCWQTMTGFTGVILTLIWAIMYIFAQQVVRSKIYNWFWYTHSLYPLFFIFMILHGTGRLIQPPFTYYFLLGPVILFTIDNLVSLSRKRIIIPVTKAEILPSNVTMLEFRKPDNFGYKSGQWIRIACLGLNKNEYHPFTLSSAPDEDKLTVHIRSVGPWTTHIRKLYDLHNSQEGGQLPNIYLDGPYGEGHQDWNLFDVSILIGGGIGVTPFASILKDVSFKSQGSRLHCKQVYFIWVSRTQKQFEWLVDIIRDVENKDLTNFVSCHIFITQFYEKFDLRTILLYICERHYQRVSNKSLFTNLRAVTHFGRPVFSRFFKTVQNLHVSARRIGVFSCGPPSMTSSVDEACTLINQHSHDSAQRFEHHFKNF